MWTWWSKELLNVLNSFSAPWGFVPGYHDYEADENSNEDNMFENVRRMNRMMVDKANQARDFKLYDKKMNHELTYNIPIYSSDE